jgi:hypothetical protein
MNKIKNQLEFAIEEYLKKLVSENFEFIINGGPSKFSQINGVELYEDKDFDEELRDGECHPISLQGAVSVFERTRIGSKLVILVFRQSNVEIKFDWDTRDFSIKDVEKFRFSKS